MPALFFFVCLLLTKSNFIVFREIMTATHYPFALAGPDGDFFVHGTVRARSLVKAQRKARRIQIQKGWSFVSLDPDHCIGGHVDWRREKKRR
jgi:hypothetical protein